AVPKVSRIPRRHLARGGEFFTADGKKHGETMSMREARNVSHPFAVEAAGLYRLVFDLEIRRSANEFDPGHCAVMGEIDGESRFRAEVSWRENRPLHYEFTESLTPGRHAV